MSAIRLLWLLSVASTLAIDVDVSSEWKPDLGWQVTCNWQTMDNDTLQSVRLYNNGQQFMIYRPEKHGLARNEVFRTPEEIMNINCGVIKDRGQKGFCVLLMEPYQPPINDFTYSCEVSGERPMFRIGKKDFLVRVLVPPSDAVLVSDQQDESLPNRVMLNCSSTGLPAPNLQWTVNNDKLQADFTGRVWNATSKLWKVWSFLSYTHVADSKVLCRPEVNYNGDIVNGKPAEYNSVDRLLDTSKIALIAILILSVIRVLPTLQTLLGYTGTKSTDYKTVL